jgi:16S rRNA (adenine1518-N6/adenine1519-N6)-dimethyltransferase
VLVFNPEGKLFLQKRSAKKDRHPRTWDSSASGHLDSGEDYDHAAARELREELGWSPSAPLRRILRIESCAETDQEFVWVYRCEGGGPFQLHPDEIECGAWFSPDEITRWIAERPQDFAPVFPYIWRHLPGLCL